MSKTEVLRNNSGGNKPEQTKGLLEELFEKIENTEAGEKLENLKRDVLEFSVFEGKDENGNVYESITISEIMKEPINLIKGLALEVADSFPMLEGVYKWVFLNYSFMDIVSGENKDVVENSEVLDLSPVADDYYLNKKRVDVGAFENITEKEADLLSEIQENQGPLAENVIKVFENNKSINDSMERIEFLDLMKNLGWACEDYGMEKDIYLPYFLGVAKKESSFRLKAWNNQGATGIFQHMTQFLDNRIPSAAKKLSERGVPVNQKVVKESVDLFQQKASVRKDRASWPDGVEEMAFGSEIQSYMMVELTQGNFSSLKNKLGDRAKTSELYTYLYLAHNMGLSNAIKIANGEKLSLRWANRLNELQEKGILSGVTDFSVKMRKELYGKMSVNRV